MPTCYVSPFVLEERWIWKSFSSQSVAKHIYIFEPNVQKKSQLGVGTCSGAVLACTSTFAVLACSVDTCSSAGAQTSNPGVGAFSSASALTLF